MADEFDDYLAGLSDKMQKQLSAAIQDQAEQLSQAQQDALRTLEQPPEETGDLERSCVVVRGATELEFVVQAGGETATDDGYDRALSFEFGSSHQPARPFFYPTYRARRDDMQQAIDDAVNEVLK